MRNILFSLILLIAVHPLSGQSDTAVAPPYKRFPAVPPFRLLQTDSSTVFTKASLKKNKSVLVMLFSPDCEHCRHETEDIISRIRELKKIQIVMATIVPFNKMKQFYTEFALARFDNITVGRDIDYLLPSFYDIRNLPFLALYDKKRKLIEVVEGSLPVEKILAKFE